MVKNLNEKFLKKKVKRKVKNNSKYVKNIFKLIIFF